MLALADRSIAVSILHLIRRQAEQRPDSLAFIAADTNERLTYAELCERVDVVARWLKERGCGTHESCGLLVPEGIEVAVYALAILSAWLFVAPIGVLGQASVLEFFV